MATYKSGDITSEFSRDDLLLLAKSFKDDKFRKLLGDFAKEINDPKKQKHYECEVKKWGKQNGFDVVFLDQNPGFSIVLGGGNVEGDPVCVNICTSDVIQKPSFVRSEKCLTLGHTWSIPHAVIKPRKEIVTGEKQLLRELCGECADENSASQLKQLQVHDVVFHPDTLRLANSNHAMKQCVIQSAIDSINKNCHLENTENPKIISSVGYVGKPMKSMIKKIVNQELYDKSEQSFFKEDERTSNRANENVGLSKPCEDNQSTNVNECVKPNYSIKYVNKVDIQDFALPLIPTATIPAWRPEILDVEVQLPGVQKATEVDAEVFEDHTLKLSTSTTPPYKLQLSLPYPVDETNVSGKFDVASHKLNVQLTVIPSKHTDQMPLPSPSSDSGIECENGYRTSSDGDNSSEVSVSSQEDVQVQREAEGDDDENCVFESAPSSPIKAILIPSYTLKQTKELLHVILHCGSIVPSSVDVCCKSKDLVRITLTSIGGGQTRLFYGISISSYPHTVREGGLSYVINKDNLEVVIKKAQPSQWESCQIGNDDKMTTVQLERLSEKCSSPVKTKPTSNNSSKEKIESAIQVLNNNDAGEELSPRKPRVVRAVSMCESTNSIPNLNHKSRGPTCSWPKGILKHRTRSLSESNLGNTHSLEEAMVSLEISRSLDYDVLEDKDGEEGEEDDSSIEEGMISSYGEKKSVRFNDVVSRQVFRSNSSILGQRAKNQKRAMKKKISKARKSSENSDSETNQCYSDPGPMLSDMSVTTTTEEEDNTNEDVKEGEENNLNLNNKKKKNKSKKKKNTSSSAQDLVNNGFTYKNIDAVNNNNVSVGNILENGKNISSHKSDNLNENINETSTTTSIEEVEDGEDGDFIVHTSKKKKKNNKYSKFEPANNLIFQLDIEQ